MNNSSCNHTFLKRWNKPWMFPFTRRPAAMTQTYLHICLHVTCLKLGKTMSHGDERLWFKPDLITATLRSTRNPICRLSPTFLTLLNLSETYLKHKKSDLPSVHTESPTFHTLWNVSETYTSCIMFSGTKTVPRNPICFLQVKFSLSISCWPLMHISRCAESYTLQWPYFDMTYTFLLTESNMPLPLCLPKLKRPEYWGTPLPPE
jgi:hypothetical protein